MSSDQQELSIERQQRDAIAFCKAKGYEIVAIYIDEGKSGSKDVHKRLNFLRMIREAPAANWERIICVNTNRFGRLNSITGAKYKEALVDAGKILETIENGVIDWNTMQGRIVDAIRSELDHEYSVNQASATTSGRNNVMDLGYWPHGKVPYGYDRIYFYEGKEVARIKRTAKASGIKARGWHLKLEKNEEEAKIIQWIFDTFCDGDSRSMRGIARKLNEQGIPSPGGGSWDKDAVKDILTKRVYIGQCSPGYRRTKKTHFKRMEKRVKENSAPIIIKSRKVFDRVQELVRKQGEFRPARQLHGNGALSGVLVCGHCGYRMEKRARKYRSGEKYVTYACSTASQRPQGCTCRQWSVTERAILPFVIHKLIESVDSEVLKVLRAKPAAVKPNPAGLADRAAELKKQIAKGVKNYTQVGDEDLKDLQDYVKTLRTELAGIEAAESAASDPKNETGFSDWWRGVRAKLVCIQPAAPHHGSERDAPGEVAERLVLNGEVFGSGIYAEPMALRSLLNDLGLRVELFWTSTGRYSELDRARIQAEFGEQGLDGKNATLVLVMKRSA